MGGKISKIVDAVKGIPGISVKKKALKKAKAIKRFIEKMEASREELHEMLEKGEYKKVREKELRRHLETLDTQIKKTRKILEKMGS